MQKRIIATLILVGTISLSGCESKQEKVTRLGKVANDLEGQYRRDCFDPYKTDSGKDVSNALRGTAPTAEDKSALAKKQQEEQARVSSPHCQDLKVKKTTAGQAWAAAQNAAQ